jgi:D5 N terminal like
MRKPQPPTTEPRRRGQEPLQTAAAFHSAYKGMRGKALRRYRHTWYRWEGPNYRAVSAEDARVDMTEFLASGTDIKGDRFRPKPGDVSAALTMLMSHRPAIIDSTVPMPGWLPGAPELYREHDPRDLISCKNGLVDLRTGKRLPHTPYLLTATSTGYDHSPTAARPRFEKFLDEIFLAVPPSAQRISMTGLTSKKSPSYSASFYRRSSVISSRVRRDIRRSSCSLGSPARAKARLAASCASYSANRMSSVSRWPLSITTSAPRT